MSLKFVSLLILPALAAAAQADPFNFVTWDLGSATATSVHGTISSNQGLIGVDLTGPFDSVTNSFNVFAPDSTYVGGIVGNAPNTGAFVKIIFGNTFNLHFSQTITNLAFDLWSVGQGGVPITYSFDHAFTEVAGGPNSIYGGSALTVVGNDATGVEGNGTLLFSGPLDSLTFIVKGDENYHGFTLGLANDQPAAPAPAAMVAFAGGALVRLRRRKR